LRGRPRDREEEGEGGNETRREEKRRRERQNDSLTIYAPHHHADTDPELYDVSALPPSVLEALEADSFWCLSKLLDGIQDNYIFAQPGIQRQVKRMRELCERVDGELVVLPRRFFAWRWVPPSLHPGIDSLTHPSP
jgi:hypothetical protein